MYVLWMHGCVFKATAVNVVVSTFMHVRRDWDSLNRLKVNENLSDAQMFLQNRMNSYQHLPN